MLSSRHRSLFWKCLQEKSFSLQFPVVIYNLLSLQPVLPCNLSSVSAFFSAKNSYNGYIKSSKFWFPFSLFCHLFLTLPPVHFSAFTTWTVSNLPYFTVCCSSLCPVYHHPSLYFICKALGDCFWVVYVGYQLQLSSRWCYCLTVRGDEWIRCAAENTTSKHFK